MNLHTLADSLNPDEQDKLLRILYDMLVMRTRANMRPIHEDEKLCVDMGYYIHAIKLYRIRLQSSLLEAKLAVDQYRGN